MMMALIEDDSLVQEFITESQEHLSAIEPDLLAMEGQAPEVDQDIVNRIFRAIHSIKGAAGFFGFEKLKQLSHAMESVLMRVRDKQLVPEAYMVEPLLLGVDKLRCMVEDIANSELVDCEALIPVLTHYTQHNTPYSAAGNAQSPATEDNAKANVAEEDFTLPFGVEPEVITRAKAQGNYLFKLQVSAATDLHDHNRSYADLEKTLKSLGKVLGSNVGADEQEAPPEAIVLLFATVLEADLLPAALELPEEGIVQWNADKLLESLNAATAKPTKKGSKKATAKAAPAEEATPPSTPAPEAPCATAEAPAQAVQPVAVAKPPAAPAAKAPAAAANPENDTIRVRVDLLNKLMDFAGELVLSRNQLTRVVSPEGIEDKETLTRVVQSIDMVTSALQEHIMQTRMQPIEAVFRRFPRVVRDLASQLGKKIDIKMEGQEVELDKSILESLADPLTHMIRNCCDHGIETIEERRAAGRPEHGTILMHAYHEGGQMNLDIKDDGRGIDVEKVGNKAVRLGLMTQPEFEAMSHQERLNLIFHPGLSTAEKVSDVSGRGVGMDVVRSNIVKLGGTIHLDSTLGKGTTVRLQLPLTLAIIPSLVVRVGPHRFAIPQVNLLELVRVRASEIHQKIEHCGKASVLRLRGRLLPLVKLGEVLQLEPTYKNPTTGQWEPEKRQQLEDQRYADPVQVEQIPPVQRKAPQSDYNILVLRIANNQYGLVVDEVLDTEEIVVKPLAKNLKHIKAFSGTTIMGDGQVAMICDVNGLAALSHLNFSDIEAEESRRRDREAKRSEQGTLSVSSSAASGSEGTKRKQAIIIFSNHEEERFALPLNDVLRLEKIKLSELELVGNREFITYRGESMPLIRLEDYLAVRPSSAQETDEAFMIVPTFGSGKAGIYAQRIVDTVELEDYHLDEHLVGDQQVNGSAVVQGHMTLFLNAQALLQSAGVWLDAEDLLAAGSGAY
jgi:two-component system chemotaxis sensor kinase CheA